MPAALMPREGDRVSFRIADVFLPEPEDTLAALTTETVAEGQVMKFSDSGNQPKSYAVVEITPRQQVLVPVTALRVVVEKTQDDDGADGPTEQR